VTTTPPTSTRSSAVGWPSTCASSCLHPTSASWLNLVEVFFAITSRQALRRGDFSSVADLVAAIGRFVDAWNERCQPFRWVRDADQILGKLARPRPRP
jgi:hypothetical protein